MQLMATMARLDLDLAVLGLAANNVTPTIEAGPGTKPGMHPDSSGISEKPFVDLESLQEIHS